MIISDAFRYEVGQTLVEARIGSKCEPRSHAMRQSFLLLHDSAWPPSCPIRPFDRCQI